MIVVGDRANNQRNPDGEHGQDADFHWRRRRRQVAPVILFSVIVVGRRRRRGRTEIVEGVKRLRDVKVLVGRRRRQVVVDHRRKIPRRFVSSRDHRETSARIGNVRAMRIATQIRPIGAGRVGVDRAAPEESLASRRKNRAHTTRLV
jgi:hypothetical protein